jgi:hypothetical protein
MKHRLTIGLLKSAPGWELLLRQLGVAFEPIARGADIATDSHSAVIVNDVLTPDQYHGLIEYLGKGGAVLDQGFLHARMYSGSVGRKRIRCIPPERNSDVFRETWLLDVYGLANRLTNSVRASGTGGIITGGTGTGASTSANTRIRYSDETLFNGCVRLGEYGGGPVGFLGLDIDSLMTDTRSRRKQFYTAGRYFPSETVALVSKGEIGRLTEALLKWLHFARGLPFVHKWRFPGELQSLFSFRLDTDGASDEQLRNWYGIAREHGIRISWFVHGEPMEGRFSVLHDMEDQELALHGYRHRVYPTAEENRENIAANRRQFESAGISCTGFSAPYGTWSLPLAEAVESEGLPYTSEFGLDYDSLPSYPWLGDRFASAPQVPIHPVCTGSFLHLHASPADITAYYRWIIDIKIRSREPVILYDHPLHPHPEISGDIFELAGERQLKNFGFAEYAQWWNNRTRADFQVYFETAGGSTVEVRLSDWPEDLRLRIAEEKREAMIGSPGIYSELPWRPLEAERPRAPEGLEKTRRLTRRLVQFTLMDKWRRR